MHRRRRTPSPLLDALELTGKVLLVLGEEDEAVWRSFRNLGDVHCLFARELNAYDVLVADYVVFTRETLPGRRAVGDARSRSNPRRGCRRDNRRGRGTKDERRRTTMG